MISKIVTLPKSKKILVILTAETSTEEVDIFSSFVLLSSGPQGDTLYSYIPESKTLRILIPYESSQTTGTA